MALEALANKKRKCYADVGGSPCSVEAWQAMTVYSWTDRRNPAAPRAAMQRGECERQQCGQYSISISNGEIGLTIRFETQAEFARFLETGQTDPLSGDT
jgi:hypothetical protein